MSKTTRGHVHTSGQGAGRRGKASLPVYHTQMEGMMGNPVDVVKNKVVMVPLERIEANPYQPRETEDPAHVKQVAASIERDGLLQIPAGRMLVNGHVQLAFGHTRLAAFRLLAQRAPDKYGAMPVRVSNMDNEALFRAAVAENIRRKQLNPIETARALKRYMDEFGKSASEAGELFGLSDSAVRNKLRLLGLEEKYLQALRDGRVTEGAARLILQTRGWSEEAREAMNLDIWLDTIAETGGGEKEVKAVVEKQLGRHGMAIPWQVDEAIPAPDVEAPERCSDCPMVVGWQGKRYCVGEFRCWLAKYEVFERMKQADVSIETPAGEQNGMTEAEGDLRAAVPPPFSGSETVGDVEPADAVSIETADTETETVTGDENDEREVLDFMVERMKEGDIAVWKSMLRKAYPWWAVEAQACGEVECVWRIFAMAAVRSVLNSGGAEAVWEMLKRWGVEVKHGERG